MDITINGLDIYERLAISLPPNCYLIYVIYTYRELLVTATYLALSVHIYPSLYNKFKNCEITEAPNQTHKHTKALLDV